MDWNEHDREELERREITVEEAERQLDLLRRPSSSVELVRPATAGDGIVIIEESEMDSLVEKAGEMARKGRLQKFVPASGAATRMFSELMPALEPSQSLAGAPQRFIDNLDEFPFAGYLEERTLQEGISFESGLSDEEKRTIIRLLLTSDGLGYADLAKGLILFHRYGDEARTAFEEQIREGVTFLGDGREMSLHFTVPQSDLGRFSIEEKRVAVEVEQESGLTPRVSFSVQHPSTDTLAITPAGDPFRTDERRLLFRPGGHGALLRNLSRLDGDVVFIKNIDNVRPQHAHEAVARWYQVLIGYLGRVEDRVRNALRSIDEDGDTAVTRALAFVSETFGRPWRGDRDDVEAMKRHVRDALQHPLRVCAVVRNEGEPGGAPFWVRGRDGSESLQIVESSQIDMDDSKQRKIFGSSTHFNPVAIACAVRDPKGEPYDLAKFVDHDAAFVAQKTHEGRELRALEHPGLWNGAMAGWNSIFVELPAFTFAPVKTVFDLLRDAHLAEDSRG